MYKFLDLVEEMVGSLGTIFDHSWELCNLVARRLLGAVSKYFHHIFWNCNTEFNSDVS